MSARPALSVALVEDDAVLRAATVQALLLEGANVEAFADARAALAWLAEDFAGVVVTDVRLPGMSGIALFEQLREMDPSLPVILVTGHGDIDMAVNAMRGGAADFLAKPFSSADLLRSIKRAFEQRVLALENRALRQELQRTSGVRGPAMLQGSSPAVTALRSLVEAVGNAEIDVVIKGEQGTGKTTLARHIHDMGPRAGRPFVAIDNGVLAHEDAELLLFGRDPAAGLSRTGLLERANGGTLLLDDVAEFDAPLRARLLAMLDSRTVIPIGADRGRRLNLRIVLARQSSDAAVQDAGSALERRLGAVSIALPSLAERREDLATLLGIFVRRHELATERQARKMSDRDREYLQLHTWAGNLRELDGYARALVLGVPMQSSPGETSAQAHSLAERVAQFERSLIEDGLRRYGGNVEMLRAEMQIPRKTLYDKLRRYGLVAKQFRSNGS